MATTKSDTGIGCFTVVFIVLLVLKLANVEPIGGWSWWWVFAPIWLPAVIGVVSLFMVAVIYALVRKFSK